MQYIWNGLEIKISSYIPSENTYGASLIDFSYLKVTFKKHMRMYTEEI